MTKTLFIYLFGKYLRYFLWLFLGIFCLILLIDFTVLIDRTSQIENFSVVTVFLISLMRTPQFAEQALPFVALFSGIGVLLTLNRNYELVIARSVGVSAWQFLAPICAAALFLGLISLAVFNPLSTYLVAQGQDMEFLMFGNRAAPSSRDRIPWLRQDGEGDGEIIIGAMSISGDGKQLGSPTFYERNSDNRIVARIDADTAEFEDGRWILKNSVRRTEGQPPERMDRRMVESELDPALVEESLIDPDAVSFWHLPGKIALARSVGKQPYEFAMKFHRLLAQPALFAAMVLIAATVSLRFVRFGQAGAMILGGVFCGFMLYVVTVLVEAFGSGGIVSPVIAAWFPVVVAVFLGATVLFYKEDG